MTYWTSHSNKVDAFIVFISVLLMSVEDSGLEILRSLRCGARGLMLIDNAAWTCTETAA